MKIFMSRAFSVQSLTDLENENLCSTFLPPPSTSSPPPITTPACKKTLVTLKPVIIPVTFVPFLMNVAFSPIAPFPHLDIALMVFLF